MISFPETRFLGNNFPLPKRIRRASAKYVRIVAETRQTCGNSLLGYLAFLRNTQVFVLFPRKTSKLSTISPAYDWRGQLLRHVIAPTEIWVIAPSGDIANSSGFEGEDQSENQPLQRFDWRGHVLLLRLKSASLSRHLKLSFFFFFRFLKRQTNMKTSLKLAY